MRFAFTLIELLVVVTIVVVLIALLAPALDMAVYQAELAVCGAGQHAVVASTIEYTISYRRAYPHRVTDVITGERPIIIQSAYIGRVDDRPVLATYLSLNAHLNDPMTRTVDLAGSHSDSAVVSSIALWFGFRYKVQGQPPEQGMYKLGDRFTWQGDSFSTLTSDWDGIYVDSSVTISTHPDRDGTMWQTVFQDQDFLTGQYLPDGTGAGASGVKGTYSTWHGGKRGVIDTNYGIDDGSVIRFNSVRWNEASDADPSDRFIRVPQDRGKHRLDWETRLPRR